MRKVNFKESEEWIFLISCRDDQEADILESFLTSESIFVLRKYRGAGDYLKVACGMTNFGVDLFVRRFQYEIAQEILGELIKIDDPTDQTDHKDMPDGKKSTENTVNIDYPSSKSKEYKYKKFFIFVAAIITIFILGWLFHNSL